MRGAGGTNGGVGQFLIGLIMMCAGFYMLFNAIMVNSSFNMGMRLYGANLFGGQFNITSGMVMVPFIFGIGMLFYNAKNFIGWLLTLGSLTALIFGVISSIHFTMRSMTAFELITILVLAIGGLGLFLRSFKTQ
ncbi:hypothetical protein KCM76_10355 [Zooshikella marina]|uniref:Uncharacterized protein n=1 Tax=Zooshikella ganghwensis TaxID=202772 RepID=A0A4P9VGC3_9GAMM|nr:hypothetical protein [Zooshikella ganghwensis]MBU2706390.1 hypothetical protein [Zooshikella ganghwensis]RDH42185.1 hypothetical protein B9G39_01290 [Zooshikella ganghwensis]